jgi:hypothetical protein
MAKFWSAKGKARYQEGPDINMDGKCYSVVYVKTPHYSRLDIYSVDNELERIGNTADPSFCLDGPQQTFEVPAG